MPFDTIGYRRRPEPWNQTEQSFGQECSKLVFAPPAGARATNVHVRAAGAANTRFALLFRNYLCAEQGARDSWGGFKVRLAASVTDIFEYGQIKTHARAILMLAAEAWVKDRR